MTILNIKNICHKFDDKEILKDINLSVKKGETIGVIGPSGIGKSTLFNIIAGLLKQTSGEIIYDKNIKISYMLQKDLLLPFKTVYNNIALPLVIQKKSKKYIKEKIESKLEIFGLKGLENKYPNSLSGGERQRAALLRTYMFSDDIVLLDEPFSALDYFTKHEIHKWFLDIKNKMNLTSLIISHDIEEVLHLCDIVYILSGRPATIKKIFEIKGVDNLEKQKNMIYEIITKYDIYQY
ncbi:ABC transporter ATP-binding protein [Campylobacter sp. FMV-PI01]|uniref:ABC transporter ATP-binding protein n=1 Tax=Campylobacter portucalensis TaxID=2608384 RepID=A0A6L5WME6_9BACT|nr:ABC transporter ATP-binding protein [Campylobacter portucalensis]MSN97003.1 ABC transporter ATP-binding protein [Campylobacter portucalensis]